MRFLVQSIHVCVDVLFMKHTPAALLVRPDADLLARIGPAKCVCFRGWDAMWLPRNNTVVCSHCNEERFLPAPVTGIVVARCTCGAGKEATWFATKDGSRVCSNCGERR